MTENRNTLEEVKFICDHAVNLNCKFVLTEARGGVSKLTGEKPNRHADMFPTSFFPTPATCARKINGKTALLN